MDLITAQDWLPPARSSQLPWSSQLRRVATAPTGTVGTVTYGYRCPQGHEFEAIHGMGGPPPTACVIGDATPVSRVFYPISISFTGKGFYATDYGKGEQKTEAPASSEDVVKASDEGARKTEDRTTKRSERK